MHACTIDFTLTSHLFRCPPTCASACLAARTCTHTHTHTRTHAHTHTHKRTHAQTHKQTNTHARAHTHTHTHTHTQPGDLRVLGSSGLENEVVVQCATSRYFSAAVTSSGDVWTFGADYNGSLGSDSSWSPAAQKVGGGDPGWGCSGDPGRGAQGRARGAQELRGPGGQVRGLYATLLLHPPAALLPPCPLPCRCLACCLAASMKTAERWLWPLATTSASPSPSTAGCWCGARCRGVSSTATAAHTCWVPIYR